MIKLTGFAIFMMVLGILIIPRTTFVITWFFNAVAVSSVLGGSALILAILGFLAFPRVLLTYFLLEAVSGAPASGSALYYTYIVLAALFDLTTTKEAHNRTTN